MTRQESAWGGTLGAVAAGVEVGDGQAGVAVADQVRGDLADGGGELEAVPGEPPSIHTFGAACSGSTRPCPSGV
jgi:hypothetical protein